MAAPEQSHTTSVAPAVYFAPGTSRQRSWLRAVRAVCVPLSYHQFWLRPPWQSQPPMAVPLRVTEPGTSTQVPVASFFSGTNTSSQATRVRTGVPVLAGSAQLASRSPEAYSCVRQEAKARWPAALGWKDCRTEFSSGSPGLLRSM